MNALPGQPATGTFNYTDQGGRSFVLPVSRVEFRLFKVMAAQPDDILQLSLMVAVDPIEIPSAEFPEEKDRLCPCVTTEWLEISESQLATRGKDALDGYKMRYDDDMEEFTERPAALQDESYGGVSEMALSLNAQSESYRLRCIGIDEFSRRFEIDAVTALFEVGVRHGDGSQHPEAEAWLEKYFETSQMNVTWEKKGRADGGWHDLYGRWAA